MSQCFVIADDLTGANVTGAALKEAGANAFTVINTSLYKERLLDRYDAVIFNTESRARDCKDAYNAVRQTAGLADVNNTSVFAKRIDSTLRGNPGTETDAFLDAMGSDYVAIVVPCMPEGGRININGHLHVNGLPLDQTSAAQDPKTPVFTSDIKEIFSIQSKYVISSIYLNDIRKGREHIVKKMCGLVSRGSRIIIFDAENSSDISIIADAAVESGLKFVAVDPGTFTAALFKKYTGEGKALIVVGSVNSVTRRQLGELFRHEEIYTQYLSVDKITENVAEAQKEIERVAEETEQNKSTFKSMAIILDSIDPAKRVDFYKRSLLRGMTSEEMSRFVNKVVASAAQRVLEVDKFSGIFSCGGDITAALCESLEASGIEILSQLEPLVMYGRLADGKYAGLEIITKGGMVGSDEIILRSLKQLLKSR